MDTDEDHLSHISTLWTDVFNAHRGEEAALTLAQGLLLQRYVGAIYRYVLAAVKDPNVADDLAQEFALSICLGRFKNADPSKGRFRDYVKTALSHLVAKHFQKRRRQPVDFDTNVPELASGEDAVPGDDTFLANWRQELLTRAWEALAAVERSSGQPYHTLLEYRTKNPDTSSAQMATQFAKTVGKPLTADGVRQTLHRARQRFSELLLEEVARSLTVRQRDVIEQELLDLGLYEYCKDALKRSAP